MSDGIQFRTFQEMIDVVAPNMPHALILDWWRRVELTLRYYTIAHHNRRSLKAEQESGFLRWIHALNHCPRPGALHCIYGRSVVCLSRA